MSNNNIFDNFIFKTETIITNENQTSNNETKISIYTDEQSLEYEDSESTEEDNNFISSSNTSYLNNDENNSNENTESDFTTEYQNRIFDKYIKNNIKTYKFNEEIKEINKKNYNQLDMAIIKNNLEETKKYIDLGNTIYKKSDNDIIKICSNQSCIKEKCTKECYKNNIYRSFKNFNRGIKTIYNLLLKLIISNAIFRNHCKCCEEKKYQNYLLELEKKFNNENNEEIKNNFEPTKILELQINFFMNKFLNVIGLLDCECKFKNKYYKFYSYNYFNFINIIKIYTKTIPKLIKLLKTYFKIKENHEELTLIDDSRCIHEDIKFNKLTYCVLEKKQIINKKYLSEIVMHLDMVNEWIIESIKLTIILLNQQSLEHFMYSFKYKSDQIEFIFNKIYDIKNEFLDLNYKANNNNIISIINDNYRNISEDKNEKIIEIIVRQLFYRNKFITNYDINEILINFIIECLKRKNNILGFKWLKYIKNIKSIKNINGVELIFDSLLNNDSMSINTKISYLKIINKNKINIIEYDFVNKLINIEIGDKIILELNKEENTLFNIKDYKNEIYIVNIIKKCIINNKINILDYVLFNLEKSIKHFNIDVVSIYLLNIPKKKNNFYCEEYKYINLLKVIIKYFSKNDIKIIFGLEEKKYSPIEFCIEYEFNLSAKIFIINSSGINLSNLLLKCIEKNNTIIAGYLIEKDANIINNITNGINIITYLFVCYDKNLVLNSNSLIIFLYKILKPISEKKIDSNIINFQDNLNELFGFKILNSNLDSKDKILFFKLINNIINPLEINSFNCDSSLNTCNYPLIFHSMLLNELEITFILLNILIKNSYIKKNVKKNNDSYTIFDYYIIDSPININFIPVIFKYIKDNKEECNKFQENINVFEFNLIPNIENSLNLILILIGFILFMINNNKIDNNNNINNNYNKNIIKKNNNLYSNFNNNNKYIEITLSSDNNINLLNTLSIKDEIFIENKNIENKNIENKNIWVQSNSSLFKNNYKKFNKLKKNLLNLEGTSSNESDLSESDILFGYN